MTDASLSPFQIVERQTNELNASLEDLVSFDAIIECHAAHMNRMRDLCFLNEQQDDLHEAIMHVLEMTVDLAQCYAAYAGPDTLVKRPVRRRRARQTANSEDEDEDEDEGGNAQEGLATGDGLGHEGNSTAASISFVDETFEGRVRRYNRELADAVTAIRQGVDTLVAQAGTYAVHDPREAFQNLSYALDDWK